MNIVLIETDYIFSDSLCKYLKSNGEVDLLKTFDNNDDAIVYVEKNAELLDLILVNLDIPTLDIDTLISLSSRNFNIIALTENNELIETYLNYPYFQRIFRKPISFSSILNYISIQNRMETLESSKRLVLQNLSNLGFSLQHAGTTYLVDATTIAIRNKLKKLSEIYTIVAYNHNTDPKLVHWSVNNAINSVVRAGNEQRLQSFFKVQDNSRITAKHIISYFINYTVHK